MATIATLGLTGDAGCHVILASLHEKLIELLGPNELVFCQILKDSKAIPDHVHVVLVEGSVRTESDRARLEEARGKAEALITMGSCAVFGGIQSLCNLLDTEELMKETYQTTTTKNGQHRDHLPKVLPKNLPVHEIVKVDYAIPGCPPEPDEVASVLGALLKGQTPRLSQKNICDECEKKREGKLEAKLKRISERPSDPERCFLEQGFLCMGPATRAGCHAKCLAARMPCEGCRGPADEKYDQGLAMLDALTSAGRESLSAYPLTTMSAMYHRFSFATSVLGKMLERKNRT